MNNIKTLKTLEKFRFFNFCLFLLGFEIESPIFASIICGCNIKYYEYYNMSFLSLVANYKAKNIEWNSTQILYMSKRKGRTTISHI